MNFGELVIGVAIAYGTALRAIAYITVIVNKSAILLLMN